MAEVFDDDVTQPFARGGPPLYQMEQSASPAPAMPPSTVKRPPKFDPFADDVTITVGRAKSKAGRPAHEPVAEQVLDLRDNAVTIPDPAPRPAEPLRPPASAGNRWTPPARPNAPGPTTTRVERRRIPLWTFALAGVVIAALTFVLVYRIVGG